MPLPFLHLPFCFSKFNRDQTGQSPYWLYALSNVGSLLGLLSYPILIEPQFSLGAQSWLWSAGFGLFAVLVGALAVKTLRRPTCACGQTIKAICFRF